MNSKKILKTLEEKKDDLRKLGVKQIGLFGSFAKGKQTKKSDVDFLVELEIKTFDSYAELYLLLKKLFKREIDLVIKENLRKELNYVKNEVQYAKI